MSSLQCLSQKWSNFFITGASNLTHIRSWTSGCTFFAFSCLITRIAIIETHLSLFMDGITVKINNSSFCWGPPFFCEGLAKPVKETYTKLTFMKHINHNILIINATWRFLAGSLQGFSFLLHSGYKKIWKLILWCTMWFLILTLSV